MNTFKDTNQMYEVLGGLWLQFFNHPIVGKKFKESALTLKYNLSAPDGVIWITTKGIAYDQQDLKPDIEMTLSSDTAHKFWLQKVSLPVALAKRLITTKGAMTEVMKLLPLLKPLYELYPEICDKYGLPR